MFCKMYLNQAADVWGSSTAVGAIVIFFRFLQLFMKVAVKEMCLIVIDILHAANAQEPGRHQLSPSFFSFVKFPNHHNTNKVKLV